MWRQVKLAQNVERHAIRGVSSDHDSYNLISVSSGGALNSSSVMGSGESGSSYDPSVGILDRM